MHPFVRRAIDFSVERHHGQARFDGRVTLAEHVEEVARLVMEHGGTVTMGAAGAAHDTVEDTSTTVSEIASLFGSEVAGYVDEVTDPPHLDRDAQVRLQIASMAKKTFGARLIKIADQTSNMKMIAAHWRLWGGGNLDAYVTKACRIVEAGAGTAPRLEAQFFDWHRRFLEDSGHA